MAAKDSIGRAGAAARAARRNKYLERLLEDEELRGSLVTAYGAARSAYGRMSSPMAAYRRVVAATAAAGFIVHHIWKNLPG